jgi:Bacterial regulatory helix-turn-helix protein, lysR family/Cupin
VEYKELAQRLLIHEVRNPHLGGEAVIARLVELLFVQAVRSRIDSQPEGTGGWLVALRHPTIRAVLGKMHLALAQPALTRSVHELERELSVPLFERRAYLGVIPFPFAPLTLIAVLIAYPEIALWLPRQLTVAPTA